MSKLIPRISIEIVAALITWAVVCGLALYAIFATGGKFADALGMTIVLSLANLVTMLSAESPRLAIRGRRVAHALQLVSALSLGLLLPLDFLQVLTIIWVAMSVPLYSFRWCLVAVLALMLFWSCVGHFYWQDDNSVITVLLFATFHVFAVLASRATLQAEVARDETQALNRELVATQHLLSEASRQSERTRIARDLHDLVGHHLTALSINLQIAERLTDGVARERVVQSRSLARLLLSDVREAVSTLREQSALDFRRALDLIVENVPQLSIQLDVAPTLRIDDVDIADAVLRCIQEAITNTLRHSGAGVSWIKLWEDRQSLHFSIRDDGTASELINEGNGLRGMRERMRNVGGDLHVRRAGRAFGLEGRVPLAAV